MKLFRSKSNASSPSAKKNRISNLLHSRSKVDLTGQQSGTLASNAPSPHINPDSSPTHRHSRHLSEPTSDLPPHLPSLDDAVSDGHFIQTTPPKAATSRKLNMDSDSSAMDERAMTRKLMDVESSFVPDGGSSGAGNMSNSRPGAERWPFTRSLSPKRTQNAPTYLRYGSREVHHETEGLNAIELSSQERRRSQEKESVVLEPTTQNRIKQKQSASTKEGLHRTWYNDVTPPALYQTVETTKSIQALSGKEEAGTEYGEDSYTFSTIPSQPSTLSSPIAAAEKRRSERAAVPIFSDPAQLDGEEEESTPKQVRQRPSFASLRTLTSESNFSVIRRPQNVNDEDELSALLSQTERPGQLRDRQASQISFTPTSFSADDYPYDVDDDSRGADFALQTGGAVSADLSLVRPSGGLARLPSLASVASSMTAGSPGKRVVERQSRFGDRDDLDDSLETTLAGDARPETPRANSRALPDPTDTVLAQHVRDVQVPESIAREYRASQMPDALESRSFSPPPYGNNKNNLTLKEQNSKIDKLSKENFDLKLKIHFLYQALQNRSDEGIRDLITKNAQYQAELVKAKKERQDLRKRLRELENQQQERTSAGLPPRSTSNESDEDFRTQSLRLAQMEDDLSFFRDRSQNFETENKKMVRGWQDALNEEIAKRKQAERDTQELQMEIVRLKDHRSPLQKLGLSRDRPSEEVVDAVRTWSHTSESGQREFGSMSGSTLTNQLRQDNEDLRRDLGAQTSMLTSRNRERERLQQEIEDLKLVHRRGDGARSGSGDSVLERSVSQAHYRPASRASALSDLSDVDRDRYESTQARLRDENAMLRMRNLDLQRELNSSSNLRGECDDLTQALREADADIEQLSDAIKDVHAELQQREQDIADLTLDLRSRDEESEAFQQEIKDISDSFNMLADDREGSQATIESLQQDLTNANLELENLEKTLRDAVAAKQRLEVQQESSQSEIAFLREEQEGDKIKIGDLQSALNNAANGLEDQLRQPGDVEAMEAEISKTKDESRRLRNALSTREADAQTLAESLDELQNGLGDALGRRDGSRASLLKEVSQLRQHLEDTITDLDNANSELTEKDEWVNERDGLLEASNEEIRRLTDLINTERRNHKLEVADMELKKRDNNGRLANPEARIAQLEFARSQDTIQLAKYTEQLHERNSLLLTLWTRLSALCGPAWTEHAIEDKAAAPSLSNVSQNLPIFNETVTRAIKNLESVINNFRTRLNTTEEEIWKDFQALEKGLQSRGKRIEKLEQVLKRDRVGFNNSGSADAAELSRSKEENKQLRREVKHLRQGTFALPDMPSQHTQIIGESNAAAGPSVSFGSPRSKRHSVDPASIGRPANPAPFERSRSPAKPDATVGTHQTMTTSTIARPTSVMLPSTTTLGMGRRDAYQRPSQRRSDSSSSIIHSLTNANPSNPSFDQLTAAHAQQISTSTSTSIGLSLLHPSAQQTQTTEQRYQLRLAEMHKRLKEEREGRLLDRDGARTRLKEVQGEREGLRRELERQRERARVVGSGSGSVENDGDVD